MPEWTYCKFYVTTSDGRTQLVSGWLVGLDGDGQWYQSQAPVAEPNVTGFMLTAGGKVLRFALSPLSAVSTS